MTWSHGTKSAICWMANGAVGRRKTTELTCEWLSSLYFVCPTATFAIQLGEICTMSPSHSKGLLTSTSTINKLTF